MLIRGDVQKKGELVGAGGLSSASGPPSDFGLAPDVPEAERRRKLAEWIADPSNPLTSRVIVNRIWHYHFGTGIVATPNDFGKNGDKPSHPELLDRLARDFLADGTRLKPLHRRIMLSNTYRQSSRHDSEGASIDAEDRLLWRYPARRLEGEAIRDAMLASSGELNTKAGGPSFRPFTLRVFGSNFYDQFDSGDPEYNRRTIYRINVNSAKSPLLEGLDCPDPSVKAPDARYGHALAGPRAMNNSFVLGRRTGCPPQLRRTPATIPRPELHGLIGSRSEGRQLLRNWSRRSNWSAVTVWTTSAGQS